MREDIRKVLASVLGLPAGKIRDDASVETLEEWDSLKQINLIMALEDKFGVQFGDDDLVRMTSLDQIAQTLQKLRQ